MKVEHIPLLQIQRDLYRIPRGMGRFRAYLRTMIDPRGDDLRLPPLVGMNPMGKDHVPALLDAMLAMDAESIAARAVAEAMPGVADLPGDFKIGLVLADDLMGGWTNRYASEFIHRFAERRSFQDGWIVAMLWTSESPTPETVREEVLTSIYRTAYVQQHGNAQTLRDRMAQEGQAMARAGCTRPALDDNALDRTRAILSPCLETTDMRTAIECLFGDVAAPSLGFTARGLPERAGFALALHEALHHARQNACVSRET